MDILDRMLELLGYRRAGEHTYRVSADLHAELVYLAEQEQRPVEDVHDELLVGGLRQRQQDSGLRRLWVNLTPREQDVTALTCLGYTNGQMAVRLGVSPETIKSHLKHAMSKFEVHGKMELSRLLKDWSFKGWE